MESEPLVYLGQSSKVQGMSMESILLGLFKAQQRGHSIYSNKTGLGGETRYEFRKTEGGGRQIKYLLVHYRMDSWVFLFVCLFLLL